jgi:hypothetical protein
MPTAAHGCQLHTHPAAVPPCSVSELARTRLRTSLDGSALASSGGGGGALGASSMQEGDGLRGLLSRMATQRATGSMHGGQRFARSPSTQQLALLVRAPGCLPGRVCLCVSVCVRVNVLCACVSLVPSGRVAGFRLCAGGSMLPAQASGARNLLSSILH